jgi:hypothetical protein
MGETESDHLPFVVPTRVADVGRRPAYLAYDESGHRPTVGVSPAWRLHALADVGDFDYLEPDDAPLPAAGFEARSATCTARQHSEPELRLQMALDHAPDCPLHAELYERALRVERGRQRSGGAAAGVGSPGPGAGRLPSAA